MDSSFFLAPSSRAPRFSTPTCSIAKSSKKKAFVRPVCDTCQFCGKEYRCHRSFLRHVRGHRIVEQSSQYPKVEEIVEHFSNNITTVMENIKSKPACFEKGQKYRAFIQMLIDSHYSFSDSEKWNQFKDMIHSSITSGLEDSCFLLPSSLTAVLQKNAEHLFSDVDGRQHLSALFKAVFAFYNEEMVHFFLADYVLFLVTDTVQFVSLSVRRSAPAPLVLATGMEIEDNHYLETIHYIGGAKVRAFYSKSLKFPKHSGWKNIGRVICERLLESESVPGPPDSVKGWTAAQTRGRLFFISGLLFDFLCGVALMMEKQGSKKKVDFDDVTEKVCHSGVMLLWDDAVGDCLSQDDSFRFMCAMIQAFGQTFTVGKAQCMINSVRNKGEAAIPLRHRVAPKSTKDKPSTSK